MDHYTCDVINLIQLITSERIQQKFTSTKKVHAKIRNTVAAELNKMPGTLLTYYELLQVKAKFKNVKAQYMKKLKSIERSGANPSTLHDCTYYPYLDPYFRGNKQVTPGSSSSVRH